MSQKILVPALILMIFGAFALPAHADWYINNSGVISNSGTVMGQSTAPGQMKKSGGEQGINAPETAVQQRSQLKTMDQTQYQLEPTGDKLMIQQKTMDQKGNTVRTKTMEMNAGESLKIEQKNGSIMEIRQGNATAPGQSKKNMEVVRNQIKTRTNLPISINANNELVVTRPDGTTKIVTVLPDQAVANMTAKGIMLADDTSPELTVNESGEPVYSTQSSQEKKIFGLFRTRYAKKIEVSAETGEVVTTDLETSPLKLFLQRFTF